MKRVSIRRLVARRIEKDILSEELRASNAVLLVDDHTLPILSAAFKTSELQRLGISVVEKVDQPYRSPVPLPAVYFVEPTVGTIQKLGEDFPPEDPKKKKKRKKGEGPLYTCAHMCFTTPLPERLFNTLATSHVRPYVKGLRDVNLDFVPLESAVFSLQHPTEFQDLFSSDATAGAVEINGRKIAVQLSTLFLSMKEKPAVRYVKSQPVATGIAKKVAELVDTLPSTVCPNESSTLIVVDRTVDLLAPLLHEFTYQCMVHDLAGVDIEEPMYSYDAELGSGDKTKKMAVLDENDDVWCTLRHMHISDVITHVVEEVRAIGESAPDMKERLHRVKEAKDLREIVKAIPEYQARVRQYSLHMKLAEECMARFDERRLAEVADIEQTLATGEDPTGKPGVRLEAVVDRLLQRMDMTPNQKLRLLLLTVLSLGGVTQDVRERLMSSAQLTAEERNTVGNLTLLGASVQVAKSKWWQRKGSRKKGKRDIKRRRRPGEVSFDLSRYVPVMKDLMQDCVEGQLAEDDFPFVSRKPVAASSRAAAVGTSVRTAPKWQQRRAGAIGEEECRSTGSEDEIPLTRRLYIYVAGGMTLSEMRAAYEVAESMGMDVIIGSSRIWTAESFVGEIGLLKELERFTFRLGDV